MNWKLKALIQNLVAVLPRPIGDQVYYLLQRELGVILNAASQYSIVVGADFLSHMATLGLPAESGVFLEVGTGWRLALPTALWLGGARKVITVDQSRLLKPEIVLRDLAWMRRRTSDVQIRFAPHSGREVFQERLRRLMEFDVERKGLPALLEMMNVEYVAPVDTASLPVDSGSVDGHVSSSVLEHISPPALEAMLAEGRRVLKPDGFLLHRLSLSDHFSHTDPSISPIHFLKYGETAWRWIAGNRFMYMNRMRVDDFEGLFHKAGLASRTVDATVHPRALDRLKSGFRLDGRFRSKSPEVNATTVAWIVATNPPPKASP